MNQKKLILNNARRNIHLKPRELFVHGYSKTPFGRKTPLGKLFVDKPYELIETKVKQRRIYSKILMPYILLQKILFSDKNKI